MVPVTCDESQKTLGSGDEYTSTGGSRLWKERTDGEGGWTASCVVSSFP